MARCAAQRRLAVMSVRALVPVLVLAALAATACATNDVPFVDDGEPAL